MSRILIKTCYCERRVTVKHIRYLKRVHVSLYFYSSDNNFPLKITKVLRFVTVDIFVTRKLVICRFFDCSAIVSFCECCLLFQRQNKG